jgi:hypothetical protein
MVHRTRRARLHSWPIPDRNWRPLLRVPWKYVLRLTQRLRIRLPRVWRWDVGRPRSHVVSVWRMRAVPRWLLVRRRQPHRTVRGWLRECSTPAGVRKRLRRVPHWRLRVRHQQLRVHRLRYWNVCASCAGYCMSCLRKRHLSKHDRALVLLELRGWSAWLSYRRYERGQRLRALSCRDLQLRAGGDGLPGLHVRHVWHGRGLGQRQPVHSVRGGLLRDCYW